MAEIPCAEIPLTPSNRDPAERCLLKLASGSVELEIARIVLKDLELLHPRSLEKDVEPERLKRLREAYAPLLREMNALPLGKALSLNVESVLLRALCALHFNGFVTGVYLHLAMINHSCVPNCVKWGARDGVEHSEVRATRFIRTGEEITFSYLVPTLRSREARQRALTGQFQFSCTCELCTMGDSPFEQGPADVSNQLERLLETIEEKEELASDPKGTLQKVFKARNEARTKGLGTRSLALAHADLVAVDACLTLLEDNRASQNKQKEEQNYVLILLSRSFSIRKTQILFFSICDQSSLLSNEDKEKIAKEETRSEAEPTLQHIASGIGYFRSLGKTFDDLLTSFKDDDTGVQYFKNSKDASNCQIACDRTSRAIADLYV